MLVVNPLGIVIEVNEADCPAVPSAETKSVYSTPPPCVPSAVIENATRFD